MTPDNLPAPVVSEASPALLDLIDDLISHTTRDVMINCRREDWINPDAVLIAENGLEAYQKLSSAIETLEKDKQRLDFIERVTEQNVAHGRSDNIVQCEKFDDDEPPDRDWQVMGNPMQWGHRLGNGPTLREAIDDAMKPFPSDSTEDET